MESSDSLREKKTSEETINKDVAPISFLLISGKKSLIQLPQTHTILEAKSHLINNWPKEYNEEVPPSVGCLKLLHLGKVLEDDKKLQDYKIINGQLTTIHLTIKKLIPNEELDQPLKAKENHPKCFNCICL